jgi:hypothetical protein
MHILVFTVTLLVTILITSQTIVDCTQTLLSWSQHKPVFVIMVFVCRVPYARVIRLCSVSCLVSGVSRLPALVRVSASCEKAFIFFKRKAKKGGKRQNKITHVLGLSLAESTKRIGRQGEHRAPARVLVSASYRRRASIVAARGLGERVRCAPFLPGCRSGVLTGHCA